MTEGQTLGKVRQGVQVRQKLTLVGSVDPEEDAEHHIQAADWQTKKPRKER